MRSERTAGLRVPERVGPAVDGLKALSDRSVDEVTP